MRDDFLVFGQPVIGRDEIDEVVDSLESGWIGTGPKVQRFERMLEEYLRIENVRCLASCTAALMLAIRALSIGPGDEVIIPSLTFIASANAVEHAGATVVLVDSDPATGLMDLDAVEAAITPRTAAIMGVHLAGRPLDMDRLNSIRDRHSLLVIEDAAHAIGAEWHGTRIGGHGNLAAYSFYATKNITTGEGGALATEDAMIANRVERLALHGLNLGAWQRFSDSGFRHYEVEEPGFKYNLTDLQAAIGMHQLPQLDGWIDARAAVWDAYNARLASLPLELPAEPAPSTRHARHLYTVLVAPDAAVDRDELLGELTRHRIGVGVHYRAVHLHPYYRDRYGIRPESLPVATDISNRTVSLPLAPNLSQGDIAGVCGALAEILQPAHAPSWSGACRP
jgi:dTDP-4-amino-4,6-dideoxygalactose transaminase